MAKIVALFQRIGEQCKALRRGNQYPHIAVAHDVADLLGLEQRIQRHEDAAGSGSAKAGDDRLETLLEIDGDPLTTLKPKVHQATGKICDGVV